MNIEKIDKNFLQNNRSAESEMTEYEIPQSPFKLYGIFYDDNEKRFMRIPKTVAENTSEGCVFLMRHTSGGRLKFSTDSDTISIKATYDYIFEMSHMPKTGRAGFSLIDETDGCELVYTFRPESANGNGFCASAALSFDCTAEICLATSPLFLVPGVPLINGIIDILDGHVLIGFSRIVNAMSLIVCIAVGLSMTLIMVKDNLL